MILTEHILCSSIAKTAFHLSAKLSRELDKLAERISDMLVELEDIREEIVQRIPDEDEDTAGMLGVLEERLSVILRLQRKYGTDLAQILENSEKWRNELYANR